MVIKVHHIEFHMYTQPNLLPICSSAGISAALRMNAETNIETKKITGTIIMGLSLSSAFIEKIISSDGVKSTLLF